MGMTGMRSLTVDQASGPDRAGLDILGWPCSNGARSERGNDMTTRSNCGAVATAFCLAMVAQAVLAAPAHAYIGPGAGLSAIGTILTLIAQKHLGIDTETQYLHPSGRPIPVLPSGKPIEELS